MKLQILTTSYLHFIPFSQDQSIPCEEFMVFQNSPVFTTSVFMARAVVNTMLKGDIINPLTVDVPDNMCPIQ